MQGTTLARRSNILTAAGVAGIVCSGIGSSALAAPIPVALSFTAAPAGGNYTNFSTNAFSINASGQVTFVANLVGGTSNQGVFAGTSGSIQTVALENTAAPSGHTYAGFGIPVINTAGQVAFVASLTSPVSGGIFAGAPGSVQTAALLGAASPGGGGTYSLLTTPTYNPSGQLGFFANLSGASSQGIFAGAPGALQLVARNNTSAPAGGNYSSFSTNPAFNASGQTALNAQLTGGSSNAGIFLGAPGSVSAVALQGTASPLGPNYAGFTAPTALNNAGQVAFAASVIGSSAIFAGTPGSLQTVAQFGTPAPGGAGAGNYGTLQAPVLNATGRVAFRSLLSGATSTEGIFTGPAGSIQAAAINNTPAPGGGDYLSFNTPVMNGAGQVAFIANLTGAGVTLTNDAALYAGSVGSLTKIVREGDQIDVDPGPGTDLRTISNGGINFFGTSGGSGGEDGKAVIFNDAGVLVFRLSFTDTSSGIFTSLVPEPGTLAVLGLAAVPLMARRRRRAGGA
jgi:hypothetical protein